MTDKCEQAEGTPSEAMSLDFNQVVEAAAHGLVGEVRRALDRDSSILNTVYGTEKMVLLMVAAYGGHLEVVRLLCERGAAVNTQDRGGRTALYIACCRQHTRVVSLLLEYGANPSLQTSDMGLNALMAASLNGHSSSVSLLLAHGGQDVDQVNRYDETALWWSCCNNHPDVVRALLVEGKANRSIADRRDRMTPKQVAEYRGHHECAAVFEWFEGCERTFILHKARRVHDDTLNQGNRSRGPVPSYVSARAAAGLDLPLLEMTTMGASVNTVMATHHYLGPAALTSPNSEAMDTGVSPSSRGGAGSTEESEKEAVADFLVSDLNTELYTELMQGLRP